MGSLTPAQGAASPPAFRKSIAREYLEAIVVAVVLALFVRTYAVQAFKIPTSSMEPNLLIGDHLFVNRLVYSPSAGSLEDVVLGKREVRRGDVVVFRFPGNPEKDYVKRVVGLPGETVEVRDKTVWIDGQPLQEDGYAHFLDRGPGAEELAHELGRDRPPYGPARVPEGQLFVLGDNRDNSNDSRSWGLLPRELVKGRALFVYWSYAATREEYRRSGTLAWLRDTATALGRTRWDRFFHVIR